MLSVRKQLFDTIDCLSEQEQLLLLEIAIRFVPDDIATPDDLEAIRVAREEYERGETVKHDAIDWG